MTDTRRPFHKYQARTLFLRVPRLDWDRVVRGDKREFRTTPTLMHKATAYYTPTPVVAYSYLAYRDKPDTAMLVLESARIEPLGSITDAGLVAEGFKTRAEFRRYWRTDRAGLWLPMKDTNVWRVRPPESRDEMGEMLLQRLYGEHV